MAVEAENLSDDVFIQDDVYDERNSNSIKLLQLNLNTKEWKEFPMPDTLYLSDF